MNSKYQEYAKISAEIKYFELRKAELMHEILKDLKSRDLSKVEGEYGIFTIVAKKVWTYSSKLLKAKEDLKIKESEEQQKGVAKATESTFIKFTPIQ